MTETKKLIGHIRGNAKTGQKLLTIPKKSPLQIGDYVVITKLENIDANKNEANNDNATE